MATDVNYIERAVNGRLDLLAMTGLVKLIPQPSKGGVDNSSWRAFKKRHNMRYEYAERMRRRGRSDEGGGNG